MSDPANRTSKRKRGPYKKCEYISGIGEPRSTNWFNRTKKKNTNSSFVESRESVNNRPTLGNAELDLAVNNEDLVENKSELDGQTIDTGIRTDMNMPDLQFEDIFNKDNPFHTFADDETDHSSDDEDNPDIPSVKEHDEVPLYRGARISLLVSMILILIFVIRHKLTREATKDLLELIELHCVTPNLCKKSIHCFYGFFNDMSSPVQKHYYCAFCQEYHGIINCIDCPNCGKRQQKYFLYIPLAVQLQSIVTGISKSDLQYNVNREKKFKNNIEDIYDGSHYQSIFKDGYFIGTSESDKCKEIHLSLQFNTDGVALFRSSSYSVWPIYLTINELHPKLRYSRVNRIFAGLWFGDDKPIMNIFLKPLVQELKLIYEKGCKACVEKKDFLLRVVLLNIVCDAPAKCLVQNFNQFNGYYGCGNCYASGTSVKTSLNGSMMSYPFYTLANDNLGHATARTHTETIAYARDAFIGSETKFGIKGLSVLCKLPLFNIIKSVTVDYMHCVLLGVQKMLLNLWIGKKSKSEKYYIGDFLGILDDRMKALTRPNLISRSQRTFTNLKHWKASEYKSFLLFHSVCCLQGILSEEYFAHYLLLVEAIYILLQSSISVSELSKSKVLLRKFCAQIDFLYDLRYETYNIHNLLHLSEKVEELGPLWCHSCFFYEDLNGDLRALFHGSNQVELQISSAVIIHQKLPLLVNHIPKNSEADHLYIKMIKSDTFTNKKFIGNERFVVGKTNDCNFLSDTRNGIEHLFGLVSNIYQFYRLLSNGIMFHSKLYKKVTKTNSYTVKFKHMNAIFYGQIQYFLKVDVLLSGEAKYLAVINRFKILENCNLPLHFREVEETEMVNYIVVEDILKMCYFANLSFLNSCFVAELPVMSET